MWLVNGIYIFYSVESIDDWMANQKKPCGLRHSKGNADSGLVATSLQLLELQQKSRDRV